MIASWNTAFSSTVILKLFERLLDLIFCLTFFFVDQNLVKYNEVVIRKMNLKDPRYIFFSLLDLIDIVLCQGIYICFLVFVLIISWIGNRGLAKIYLPNLISIRTIKVSIVQNISMILFGVRSSDALEIYYGSCFYFASPAVWNSVFKSKTHLLNINSLYNKRKKWIIVFSIPGPFKGTKYTKYTHS